MNFDLAFTKLQPIVSWHAVDIKTNGPISVKCLMTDRCVGLCGQTHVVAHDKPLWNERAHLWVLCGSGTSPPAERGNRLVCSSYERSRVYHTTIIRTWPWLTSVLKHTTSIQDAFQLWLPCHNMERIIIEDLDMSSFSAFLKYCHHSCVNVFFLSQGCKNK